MKRLFVVVGACLMASLSSAQITKLEYGINFPGNVRFIDVDASGNAFVAGSLEDDETIDGTTLTNLGGNDIFIVKVSPTGAILWAKSFGGNDNDEVYDLEVDAAGNVLVAGFFREAVDFDPGDGEQFVEAFGIEDGFVLKLNTDGDFVWVRVFEGVDQEIVSGIATDASSNVYITGRFTGTTDLDPTSGALEVTATSTDAFFVRLNADGSFVWAKTVGNGNQTYGHNTSFDFAGNPVFSGEFLGDIDINPGTGTETLTSVGYYNDIFLLKLNAADGSFVWGKNFGTDGNPTTVTAMHVDNQNNIYLAGEFSGRGDFDPGNDETMLEATGESVDVYISKFHQSGNLLWVRSIGGTDYDFASGIYSDGTDVYTIGTYNNVVDFDPGPGLAFKPAIDGADIFILTLDNNGLFKSVIRFGEHEYDEGRNIIGDGAGNLYLTGRFDGPEMDMDPTGCEFLMDPSTGSSWVLRLSNAASPCVSIITYPMSRTICAASTPTVTFTVVAAGSNLGYQWYYADIEGQLSPIVEDDYYSGVQTPTLTVDVSTWGPGYNATLAVEVVGEGSSVMTDLITLAVSFPPNPIAASRCGPGSLTLKVTPVFGGGEFRWYTQPTGGTPIAGVTGTSYVTPLLTSTTTYYVSRVFESCETQRVPIVATIGNCQPIPELDWALSNARGGRVADMHVDRETGTVYATGYYLDGSLFDTEADVTLPEYGSTDVFIAKYDANRNLLWAKGIGGDDQDDTNAITVDKDGNVLIAGFFRGEADFDPSTADYMLTSAGSWDIFILKLDPNGNFVWAKRIGSTPTNGDFASSITTDADGNIYVGGYFNGTVDIDPGPGEVFVTSSGAGDGLILKLDSDGNYLDSHILRGPAYENIADLTVDAAGNIFSTGYYYDDTDFDPGAGIDIAADGSNEANAFIWKINADGTLGWYKTFSHAGDRQDGASIDLDSDGNVIAGITFEGTIDIDPGPGVDMHTAADRDLLTVKLDPNGNYIWGKTVATYGLLGTAYSAVNGTDVYMFGAFAGTVDVDPGPAVFNLVTSGNADDLIVKLNKDGEFQWGLSMGGPSLDYLMALAFDDEENIYAGGTLNSDGDYDPGPDEYILEAIGSTTGKIIKLGKPSPVTFFEISQQPVSANACEGGIATFTTAVTAINVGTITYAWQKFDGSDFIELSDDATYSGTTTATLSINTTGKSGTERYRCHISHDGGSVNTNEVELSIVTSLAAPTATDVARCGAGQVTVNATGSTNGNYRWFTSATGSALAGEVNSSYAATISGTTTFYVSIVSGSCESPKTSVTATIKPIPTTPSTADVTRCSNTTVDLTATGAETGEYRWYSSSSGGSALSTSDTYTTPALTSTVTYYVSAESGGCESPRTPLTVTVTSCANNQPPVITASSSNADLGGTITINLGPLLSDPDDNLDLSTLKIVVQPKSGATATIDQNGQLHINYAGTGFEGEDELIVEICDIAGSCVQQTIKVVVSGELTVYNAVSPNGDGKNDVFHIAFIGIKPGTQENKVTIFNRWGDVVFEVENYNNTTNVFRGFNDKGNELPSGTYFYRIEFKGDRKSETGYLSLKR